MFITVLIFYLLYFLFVCGHLKLAQLRITGRINAHWWVEKCFLQVPLLSKPTNFMSANYIIGSLCTHTPPSFIWRQTSQLDFIGTGDPSMPNKFALVSFQKIMNSVSYFQTTLEASCISKINRQLTCQKHITSFITITQPWRGDLFSVVPMTTDLREFVICDRDNKK